MSDTITIDDRGVGENEPCYVIGEIGINHNGDLDIAKSLIDVAVEAGADAVKFQKRTPQICVPEQKKDVMRETPWGIISYLEYRHHVELGEQEYREIDRYCKDRGITWFASCWDCPSVEFMKEFDPPCYKVASASITNQKLLAEIAETGKPVIMSTGMSTMPEIRGAVEQLATASLVLLHCNSTYPCPNDAVNLRMIDTLREEFALPTGYSGHEVGLQISLAAVARGAVALERHITLDRAMWGSDQAASVEPQGLEKLIRDIRVIEKAMGDGEKKVYDSEITMREKLRNVSGEYRE